MKKLPLLAALLLCSSASAAVVIDPRTNPLEPPPPTPQLCWGTRNTRAYRAGLPQGKYIAELYLQFTDLTASEIYEELWLSVPFLEDPFESVFLTCRAQGIFDGAWITTLYWLQGP
jgi:hypothetical protein